MRKVICVFVFLSMFFMVFVDRVDAIIFLPAIILIPIAKIIAVLIGGFSLPVLGASAFVNKITGKSAAKGVLYGIIILLVLGVVAAVVLKLINPNRPLI